MSKCIKCQETEHGKSYIQLCKIVSVHILTFMVVQHLSCRGLAPSVKNVHVANEWELRRPEFITTGGGEEGL